MPTSSSTQKRPRRGKFIVIDGGDGSGKATQAQLLIQTLKKSGQKIKYIDFPRYDSFFGAVVGRFLKGELGSFEDTSPYLISLAYAADRAQAAPQIKKWLASGYWVISNRYTSASMAHQTAKFATRREQDAYLSWIQELEYGQYALPHEDLVIYLHVDPLIAQTLIAAKSHRGYLGTRALDQAERDLKHQRETEAVYLRLCKQLAHWSCVECADKSRQIMSVDRIHERVLTVLKRRRMLRS